MDSKAPVPKPANTSTIIPDTRAMATTVNISLITAVRKSIADYADMTTSNALTATRNTIIDTSVNMSTSKAMIPRVSKTIAPQVNGPAIPSASASMPIATSAHASAGTLFTAGGWQTLLRAITCIGAILIIIWCQ